MYDVYDNPTYMVANKLICILYLVPSELVIIGVTVSLVMAVIGLA